MHLKVAGLDLAICDLHKHLQFLVICMKMFDSDFVLPPSRNTFVQDVIQVS